MYRCISYNICLDYIPVICLVAQRQTLVFLLAYNGLFEEKAVSKGGRCKGRLISGHVIAKKVIVTHRFENVCFLHFLCFCPSDRRSSYNHNKKENITIVNYQEEIWSLKYWVFVSYMKEIVLFFHMWPQKKRDRFIVFSDF